MKLNVGCGRHILDGWVNLDRSPLPGVDVLFDLETCGDNHLPFQDGAIDEFFVSHILEHIVNVLPLMEELYRVAAPDAVCYIRVPHGSSNDAWEDQTHVRAYYEGSFIYFEQPTYHFVDYGYRGDWKPEHIEVVTKLSYFEDTDDAPMAIAMQRNLATEILATLRAIKPPRPPDKSLKTPIRPIVRFL